MFQLNCWLLILSEDNTLQLQENPKDYMAGNKKNTLIPTISALLFSPVR